jgi:alpha-beta hydrolase superfamily lysophospholipase
MVENDTFNDVDAGKPPAPQSAPAEPQRLSGTSLPAWRYAPDAWRWTRRMNRRYVDMAFRMRSARVIPASVRQRLLILGLPPEIVDSTLGAIRNSHDWADQWIETAQRYLGDYRRQVSASTLPEAAQAQYLAAMCYHAAQIFELDDERIVRKCRAAAASLFARALPYLHPNVRHIQIPWRARSLPAYIRTSEPLTRPAGVVVLLNGASTSKEETFAWSDRFIERGYAVLALDSPGTGEATGVGEYLPDQDDILDGVFDLFADEPMIDLRRVAVVGVSLGGNQAVRCAAYDRRIMAAVAVTPPYEPARWIHRASPLLHQQLGLLVEGDFDGAVAEHVAGFSLHATAINSRQPLLVFGGGRDVIVPPAEAQLLANRAGSRATLVWQPDGGHCLYGFMDEWTFEAATWIDAVAEARQDPALRGDTALVTSLARDVLETTPYVPKAQPVPYGSTDDATEYARMLDRDDLPEEDI